MSQKLIEYFTTGTHGTVTGATIGLEVETDFLDRYGQPPTTEVARAILAQSPNCPAGCQLKLELGVQKYELSGPAKSSFAGAYEAMLKGLSWLCAQAAMHGLYPRFLPEIAEAKYAGNLLFIQEERDEIWVNLDGRAALEHLTRCSSVQYTISVNPADAVSLINQLWAAKVHQWDYATNHQRWLNYIQLSKASYRSDRYGGPEGFGSLEDYCAKLAHHSVVMHRGHTTRRQVDKVEDLNIDLFLRSVWWHYRLRRYADTLALEIRPFSRRSDEAISSTWEQMADVLQLPRQTRRIIPKYNGVR